MISAQNLPKISAGTINRIENFKSAFVQERNVDVWLPDGYDRSKRYAVVYMHDGQMLFDSTQTWNHQEWKVDETFGQLMLEKKIQNCIIVGIWNTGNDRISEYLPDEIYKGIPENLQKSFSEKYCNKKGAQGKNYLKFIVDELKPYIDKNFATLTDKDHTFMMGSSMGGLISIYALCEYPDVWGGVACLSTAWLSMIEPNFEFPLSAYNYLNKKLPVWGGHHIYMDYGTGESDKSYETTQNFIDLIIKGKHFDDSRFLSKVYEKDGHNELAWNKRLHIPVEFLMPKLKPQQVCSGKTELIENFVSNYVTPRNIEIWLPENYKPVRKYAVLYMHDGQMLFDSTQTWNKQSWDVDDVASGLMKNGQIQDFIVVGIWNGGNTRHTDYFPQKPFESLSHEQKDFVSTQLTGPGKAKTDFKPVSDNYLQFIVSELKPFIDKKYSVYKDRNHTFISGSSMGGLISMYALCEYPEIFGGAACLSTHWPGIFAVENNPVPEAFTQYLKTHLQKLKKSKLYFDYGDQTLDALYPPLQQKVDSIMQSMNPSGKYQWQTKFFPGKDHSENSWKERLHIPLSFLLKK
jgi:predicted alpha/beta superfamily hydrolase